MTPLNLFTTSPSDFDLLQDLDWRYRESRVLHVAVRQRIFDHLDGRQLTAPQLAAELGADATMTDKLLIALCALGLCEREGDLFRNSEVGQRYLVESSPYYQGHIVRHSGERVWDFWNNLEGALLSGSREQAASAQPRATAEENHRDFILGMHNLAISGSARMLAESVDMSNAQRLLDLGGGPGTHAIAFCQRYPQLHAVILDLPETLQWTRQVVESYGLSDRITLQPGSWDDESYGSDFDAAILSMIMHGPASGAAGKLKKTFAALRPGGWLLAQEFLMNDAKTGPLKPALFNLMVGAYSVRELAEEIAGAGFVDVTVAANGDRDNTLITARRP